MSVKNASKKNLHSLPIQVKRSLSPELNCSANDIRSVCMRKELLLSSRIISGGFSVIKERLHIKKYLSFAKGMCLTMLNMSHGLSYKELILER